MTGFILGKKSEQSQTFNEKGERIPTTFIRTNSCYLINVIWPEKHGYFSIKMGYGQIKNFNKPQFGEIKKAGIKTPLRFLREFRLEKYKESTKPIEEEKKIGLEIGEKKFFVGDELKPTLLFQKGDLVDVSGISKGKGFQGVVRRHHFAGGPRTHGQSDRERAPGAVGQTTTPGRIYKGKRMAGRMGGKKITVKRLRVIEVKDDGIIVSGLIPGPANGLIEVRSSL